MYYKIQYIFYFSRCGLKYSDKNDNRNNAKGNVCVCVHSFYSLNIGKMQQMLEQIKYIYDC